MDRSKYSDASHSGPTPEASSTTIEMETLESSSASHDLHHHSHSEQQAVELDEAESDDDSVDEGEDEGGRALLGFRDASRSSERSLPSGRRVGVWRQAQRIVIEVSK